MAAVLEFADVTVRRGQATLIDSISWTVEDDERWVILGPNGAGKTTLLQVASAQIHPTSGVAGILDEVLGTVDVFDLRPRIGLTSAALAERIPRHEVVHDVVVSASYGVLGRWREEYDDLDHDRAAELMEEVGVRHLGATDVRHPERGGAQAGPDRPGADDRPGAAPARRAGSWPRPRRPGGPGVHAQRARDGRGLPGHGAGLPPRRGDPARLHPRASAARRQGGGVRSAAPRDHRGEPLPDVRDAPAAEPPRRALRGAPSYPPQGRFRWEPQAKVSIMEWLQVGDVARGRHPARGRGDVQPRPDPDHARRGRARRLRHGGARRARRGAAAGRSRNVHRDARRRPARVSPRGSTAVPSSSSATASWWASRAS